jgi:ATP-binding cassette subfamily B protein
MISFNLSALFFPVVDMLASFDDVNDDHEANAPAPSGLGALVIAARTHGIHLTIAQLIHDNVLTGLGETDIPQTKLIACARNAGLVAKSLDLTWEKLGDLKKALPAIVVMKNGTYLVLLRVELGGDTPHIVLQDPNADPDAHLTVDRLRFEEAWSGETILIKRNYDIADETQPFGFGLILALIFRERKIVRDIVISALALSFLALCPILFWRILTDRVLPFHALNTFTVICLVMAVLICFETAFSMLRRYLLLRVTTRVDTQLSIYMFDKVLSLPVDFFESTPLGMITHKMGQMGKVRNFLTGQLFGTVLDAGILLFFLPVMFYFSWILSLIVIVICALIMAWIVAMLPAYRRRSGMTEGAEANRGAFLSQNINGIRTIKSLALDSKQRHEWDVLTARIAKLRLSEGDLANLIQTVVLPLERLMISGTFALGVYFAITTNDPVFVGTLFAFLILSQRIAAPLVQVAHLLQQYDDARIAVGVVGGLVNQPAEEVKINGVRAPIHGEVVFSNVLFKYKGAISPALKSVSFEVPQGTTLGIMGRSGSGKTTVTRLLQRLHSDYQGLIKIDGIDVREYDLNYLRSSLGVVLQENFLFSGTIRENITAAKSDATFEEMVYAARLAGAEEFIDRLPRGYETFIYEGSPNLSGGQRQRLAIARALIMNPKILILDEATSALDAESEAIVNANLRRIAQGRTVIVISHRLSSLVHADAILVLEQGEVHDIGRHHELLGRCDIYSGLWHQQNAHMVPEQSIEKPVYRGPSVA